MPASEAGAAAQSSRRLIPAIAMMLAGNPGWSGGNSRSRIWAWSMAVFTTNFPVTAAPLGVRADGSNSHDANVGRFAHCIVTGELNPPSGVTVIMNVAGRPDLTLAEEGMATMV